MAPYEDPQPIRAGDMPFGRPRGPDLHDAGADCPHLATVDLLPSFIGLSDGRLYNRDDENRQKARLSGWENFEGFAGPIHSHQR